MMGEQGKGTMTKGDARRLLKERGASRLNSTSIAMLGQLLESVFIPRDRQATTPLESVGGAYFTLSTLASKCGLAENTVKLHLDKLTQLGLAQIQQPEKGNRRTYSLDFTPMLEWEKTKTVRGKREKERRETKNAKMRESRARKKSAPDFGSL